MSAFHEHYRGQPATRVSPWRRLIFGSVRIPKPALILMGAATAVALILSIYLGRWMASPEVLVLPPHDVAVTPRPVVVEVPVERERIVYIKSPLSHAKANLQSQSRTWSSKTDLNQSIVASPSIVSPIMLSLDDFEPIKGASARVIKGGAER